jgi:TolA-binding protein
MPRPHPLPRRSPYFFWGQRKLVVLAALGSACFYSSDKGRMLEQRVDRLQEENKSLHDEIEATKKEQIGKIDAKIKEVEAALANLDKASRRSTADVGVQVDKLMQDVAQLHGQLDEVRHKLGEGDATLPDLATRLATAEKTLEELKASDVGKQIAASSTLQKIQRPADKKEFFDLAAKYLNDDKIVGRALMQEWLNKYRTDPLAADAHLALGDGYKADNRCREALEEYKHIVGEFPKSDRAPESLLHASPCFAKLGFDKEAQAALEECARTYAKTEAGKKCKKELEKDRKGHKK